LVLISAQKHDFNLLHSVSLCPKGLCPGVYATRCYAIANAWQFANKSSLLSFLPNYITVIQACFIKEKKN